MTKKLIIAALVLVNATLLAFVMGTYEQRANAQAFRGATDYLMVTGKISSSRDAIYIIDLSERRLAALEFDITRKEVKPYRGRELRRDFPPAGRGE